jgi:hypothetical protein
MGWITALPANVLSHILLTSTPSDDLLRHAAVCAQVCREWHRWARDDSGVYGQWLVGERSVGLGLVGHAGEEERRGVLRDISRALMQLPDRDGKLILFGRTICHEGGHILAAALKALPTPLPLTEIQLNGCGITTSAGERIAAALRPGFAGSFKSLHLKSNAELGGSGLAAMASILPMTSLETLVVGGCSCDDAGMVSLAVALPTTLHSFE